MRELTGELTARRSANWLTGAILAALLPAAWGQPGQSDQSDQSPPPAQPDKPASETPRPADLEPGVNTSATPPSTAAPAPASSTPEEAPAPRAGAPPTKGSGSSTTNVRRKPQPRPAAPSSASTPLQSGGGSGKAHDRIELDPTQITGNRELPKVLYIVPWKRSDLGDLVGKPVNSLLDEVLTPVDRDVFKRQNRYYDALKPDAAKQAAGAVPAPGQKP